MIAELSVKAQEKGIKVVTIDSGIKEPITSAYIATDNVKGGTAAADTLAKEIGEKGDVGMLIFGKGSVSSDERQKGFEDGIKKYPKIKLVSTLEANDATKGVNAATNMLTANPGINPGTLRAGQSIKLPQNAEAPPAAAATSTPAKGGATAKAATRTVAPKAPEPPATATEAAATSTDAPPIATDTPSAPANKPVPGTTSTPVSVGQAYTVQDGDFPAKIAEKFGVKLEDLLAANPGINPTDLHIGDVIVIPAKRP